MGYNYSNTALATTLNGDVAYGATSLTVVSGNGYPAEMFKIRIDTEIIVVGTRTGNVFSSLERGHEGSPQSAHSDTDEVRHVVTAEDIGLPGGSWLAAMFARPGAVHEDDDDFNDGTIDAVWTERAATGTTEWTESLDVMSVKTWSQSGGDTSVLLKPMTGATTYPMTIETAMRVSVRNVNYLMAGIIFSEGTAGASECVVSMPYWSTSEDWQMSFRYGTLDDVNGTHANLPMNPGSMNWPWMYQRLIWKDNSKFKYGWSVDGVTYEYMSDLTFTTNTKVPTHYGLWVSSWGTSTPSMASYEYFRVTESDLSA